MSRKRHVFVVKSPDGDTPRGATHIYEIVAARTAAEARERVIAECESNGVTPYYPITASEAGWSDRKLLFSSAWRKHDDGE